MPVPVLDSRRKRNWSKRKSLTLCLEVRSLSLFLHAWLHDVNSVKNLCGYYWVYFCPFFLFFFWLWLFRSVKVSDVSVNSAETLALHLCCLFWPHRLGRRYQLGRKLWGRFVRDEKKVRPTLSLSLPWEGVNSCCWEQNANWIALPASSASFSYHKGNYVNAEIEPGKQTSKQTKQNTCIPNIVLIVYCGMC